MRPIHLLTSLLFTLTTSLAASSSPTDRYTTYLSTSPKSSLDLDEKTYNDLTAKPRDYFVAALLTARDVRYGCTVCKEVQPEWDLLARSYNKAALAQVKKGKGKGKGKGETEDGSEEVPKVVWGTLDFGNGRSIFQKMMISSAPYLVVFAPTTGPYAKTDQTPFTYGFNSPMSADQMTTLLARALSTSYKPAIVRPINYARVVSTVTIVLGLFTSFTVLSPYLMPLIRNRNLWAAISLISVLLFTSGHMFNHIRKVPYISGNGAGGISYFTPGFQAQLGMESQIVAAIYAVLAFATIVLAMKVPRIADAKVQHMSVIIWGVVMFGVYSCLLNIFRFKNAGYPFWLPPF